MKSIIFIIFLVILAFHTILLKEVSKSSYDKGYKDALEDTRNGRVKMRRVEKIQVKYERIKEGDQNK